MSRRRARRRRGAVNSGLTEIDVCDMANQMRECKATKNAVPNLPSAVTEKDAQQYIDKYCLLECKSPLGKHKFGKRTHMLSKVVKWTPEGFSIQPLNSHGEKDGPPQIENPSNVWMLPGENEQVSLGAAGRRAKIDTYVTPNNAVSISISTPPPAKNASAPPRHHIIVCHHDIYDPSP